jgi:hypothetical protein
MSWLIIPLTVQTTAGFLLTFRSFSLNMWEPNEDAHGSIDWLSTGTGLIFMLSAGYGWYRWQHDRAVCWGFSGLPLLKFCLDLIGLVLLYFVLFRPKAPVSVE